MKKLLLVSLLLSTFAHAHPSVDTMGDKINGKVPPMTPSKSMFETRILDATEGLNGMELITSRTVREKGTRSPIHMHPYGGQTCVIAGEMTLYMDGAEPLVAPAGNCYWMPPNRRMRGVNTADTNTIMLDSFVVPKGTRVWLIVEPGFEDAQDQFDKTFETHQH